MSSSGFISLPSIRKKILRSFFLLVFGYAILGTFLVFAVFLANRMTPTLIHLNYDSIAAASLMKESWSSLQQPDAKDETLRQEWINQFEQALRFEKKNASNNEETHLTAEIGKLWDGTKQDFTRISQDDTLRMENLLDSLVALNEKGMFEITEQSYRFSRRVLMGSAILFLSTLLLSLYLADGLATRLAKPLKEIAERIKSRPLPGKKLKLPIPDSLEMRILTQELGRLWDRLSDFTKLNVEEIASQQKKLETVLEAVEDAVLVLDPQGQVIHCNEGMLKLLSLPEDSVDRRNWRDLSTTDENYLKLRSLLTPEMSKHKTIQLTVDGEVRVFSSRYRNILGAKTQVAWGVVYLLHDITEIRQREHMKAEFLGTLANEMRSPLEQLSSVSDELVLLESKMDSDMRVLLGKQQEFLARIRAIANDFMQVSLIDLHTLKLRMERIPLSLHLKVWIKPFQVVARDKNVEIEFIKDSFDEVWGNIDVVKFPWVVSNLISNAIRVAPENTRIRVVVTDRRGIADIEIQDEGEGIPEEVQGKMFEPYFEGARDDEGSVNGYLGLGLTIAKEIVEAHGGVIDYFMRYPKGSNFRVALPLAEPVG